MTTIIGVRFKAGGKMYYFDPQDTPVTAGEDVIVETTRGLEYGQCVQGNTEVPDQTVVQPLKRMVRVATDADKKTLARNKKRADEAFIICKRKIEERGLEMNLVTAECTFDMNKMLFYFTADGRVDFRELVKDLAGVFHARIELRQIGVRDEAKMLGGLGICGQPFCCKRFLDEFQPVSIKMAKTQNLSLNPTKISGSCGRLMCCLKYEQHAYEDAQSRMPKNDSFVQTPDGPGNISAVNLVRETVTVRLDNAPEAPKTYRMEELIVLRNGKGSRDGIEIPARPPRLEKEPVLDDFGMEIPEKEPTVRQFRNAPSPERMKESKKSSRGGEKNADKGADKEKAAKETVKGGEEERPAKENKTGGEKSRRSHRGGRGRRGGEKNEAQRQQPGREKSGAKAAAENRQVSSAPQQPRPLRFGTSIPFASGAASAAPAGEGKSAEHKSNHRRGRRSSRRGRGGSGGKGPDNNQTQS